MKEGYLSAVTNISTKWTIYMSTPEIMNLVEENIRKTLQDIGIDTDFLSFLFTKSQKHRK